MPKKVIRFSAADRALIQRQAIGKPTGVKVEVGGIELDLVPLTTEQADEVFCLFDTIVGLQAGADSEGIAKLAEANLKEEGHRIGKLLKSVLHESAVANNLIDDEEVFEEWFKHLPVVPTIIKLLPFIVQAQGMGTALGNFSTPPSAGKAAESTSPST